MDALEFHELTKHTPISVRRAGPRLDWSNKPHPFKQYTGPGTIRLPEPTDTGVPALDAITEVPAFGRRPDAAELCRILRWSGGVLRSKEFAGGERFHYRTYASAGALYPNELYVAVGRVDGLEPGLYHFNPLHNTLVPLRRGDVTAGLARAVPRRAGAGGAPATVVLTGIPWRTVWKYGARGYRHLYWDAGMIVANLVALAASGGHRASVVAGFGDSELDGFLGIDGRTEMSLAVVPIDPRVAEVAVTPEQPPPLAHPVRPPVHVRVPSELLQIHDRTRLASEDAAAWGHESPSPPVRPQGPVPCPDGIERVIRRRGSARAFRRQPVALGHVRAILQRATSHLSADWGQRMLQVHMLALAVEGLEPGAYVFEGGDLQHRFSTREPRDIGRFLCLEQPLGGDGAATFFLMADLDGAVRSLGDRAYRAAQLEAGITAGRIYLGAYACRLGATGLTFYDDEVSKFFGTSAEPMLVVALGHPGSGRRLL